MNIFKKLFCKGAESNKETCNIEHVSHRFEVKDKNNRIYKKGCIEGENNPNICKIEYKINRDVLEVKEASTPFLNPDDYYTQAGAIDYLIEKLNIKDNSTGFFTYLCEHVDPDDFIEKYESFIDWVTLSKEGDLSADFIRKYQDKVDWNLICEHQDLTEYFIKEFEDKVNWNIICEYQRLSECFMKDFAHRIVWSTALARQSISEFFLRYLLDDLGVDINLGEIISFSNVEISEQFVCDYKDYINWDKVSYHLLDRKANNDYILSEDFVKNTILPIYVDRKNTSFFFKLCSNTERWSLDFIRRFKDELDWNDLSREIFSSYDWWDLWSAEPRPGKISLEDFIEEFKDYINWGSLMVYKNRVLPMEILAKYTDRISFDNLVWNEELKDIINFIKDY